MSLKQNIIYLYFKGRHLITSKSQYQYNHGQYLYFADLNLPQAFEVHFSNKQRGESKTQIGSNKLVEIPDEYFWSGALEIYAWIYLHSGNDDGETIYEVKIPLIKRAKPTDEEPLPVQQSAIDKAIAELNNAVDITNENADKTNADKTQVSTIKEEVVTLKEEIDSSASVVNQDAQSARESADASEQSAQNSAEFENDAHNYADEAKGYAQSALESKDTASQKAQVATDASAEAKDFRDEAETFKNEAEQAKQNIVDYRNETKGYRDETLTAKNDTQTIKGDIQSLKTQIDDTADNVFENARKAYQSMISADDASLSASESAESASQSAQTASEKADAITGLTAQAQTLPEGSSATANYNPETGVMSFGIPKGKDGTDGDDGYSPTASVSKSGKTATITITDKNGMTSAQVEDGTDGTDGISPTVTITPITGGHRITITDNDGEHSADVMDGTGNVDDVQINGQSIVNDGVANVPIAGSNLGVVKIYAGYGVTLNSSNALAVSRAGDTSIKAGTEVYKPITPVGQHRATFYGLAKAAGDTTQSASSNAVGNYTENAKSKISEMLGGSVTVSGTTPTIVAKAGIRYVCGEIATLDFTPSQTGICDVVFTSGNTATVLTVPSTIKWANGFDPTSLEANTTYEINIMDGLGVACAWS